MLPVRIHAEAEDELLALAVSLDEERRDEFLDAFRSTARDLATYPEMGRRSGRVRKFRIDGFRCSIVYQVHDDHIYVIAVAHHSRRPNYWRRRLR